MSDLKGRVLEVSSIEADTRITHRKLRIGIECRTSEELKQVKKIAREKSVETIEKLFVLDALKRNGWNATRSAEETGMQRANFQALMKKYGIHLRDGGGDPEEAASE